MNQPKDLKNSAPDESICSLLVGFNFLFFTGLLAFMLILPLKAVFSGSDAEHGTDAGHDAVADAGHDAVVEVHLAAGGAEAIAPAAGKAVQIFEPAS